MQPLEQLKLPATKASQPYTLKFVRQVVLVLARQVQVLRQPSVLLPGLVSVLNASKRLPRFLMMVLVDLVAEEVDVFSLSISPLLIEKLK